MLIAVTFNSCNDAEIRDEITTGLDQSPHMWKANVKSSNGMLVFQNWEEADQAVADLSKAEWGEVIEFGQSMNFVSQAQIFHEIVDAEEAIYINLENKYPGANSLAEAKEMGYVNHTHSYQYQSALKKRLLTVEQDDETAHVYDYSVIDPTLVPVLDENGMVAIGKQLWQFTSNQIKFQENWDGSSTVLLSSSKDSNEELGIRVITRENPQLSKLIRYDWTLCGAGGNCNTWIVVQNNNRRARYSRTGWSEIDDCGDIILYVKFYTNIKAQRRRFGIWHYANSYRPTFTFNGNWSFSYDATNDGGCCLSSCATQYTTASLQTGVTTSPMVNRTYFGNNTNQAFGCHPHVSGYRTLSSTYHYVDPINTSVNSFTCSVNGVSLD